MKIRQLGYLIVFSVYTPFALADLAQTLFAEHHRAIYQIRLIELASGKKSSIGSGFQIQENGLIATNFHVVSGAVHKPEKYRLEYLDHEGKKGDLKLLDIDVIHDLALVRHDTPNQPVLKLAENQLKKGEAIFSIGNPYDIGMTVIKGIYNGLVEGSFYERIHFSGSLNPGMSGGPTLNASGEVVGINVATSGNQISFLVPLSDLEKLLEHHREQPPVENFKTLIRDQLMADQKSKYATLMDLDWPKEHLGEGTIIGEISDFTRCWGETKDDKEQLYKHTYSRCAANDSIYIASDFNTGKFEYEFFWYETEQLNPLRFYSLYENGFGSMYAPNWADKDHVTNFECHQDYIQNDRESPSNRKSASKNSWNTVLCTRAYRDYPGLFDLLFINAYLGKNNVGLITHFALTSVSQETGLAFTRRYLEHVKWN